MPRVRTPEFMDAPDARREDLDGALRFIRAINRRLGGAKGLIACLSEWSRNWPKDRPVTLLDVGTGSADIPVAARVWALERGFDLRVLGVDSHATTLELAQEYVAKQPNEVREGIRLHQADALRLTDTIKPDEYDYAHAGMFLHHLSDIEAMTVLAMMDRIAKRGICWNDLSRSAFARFGVRVLTLGANEMVKHDARVSVEAGFTRAEAMSLSKRVGLEYCSYRSMFFAQRFVVSGEKPGAWGVP
jgi:ubiquinone/menaquinone biosynthesis C-methylase UbiE